MRTLSASLLLGVALSFSVHGLHAQALNDPQMPRVIQPKPLPPVTGPVLNQPLPNPSAVPANPSQRVESAAPIQSVGPAAQVMQTPKQQAAGYGTPVDVMDASGRTISGAVQVSPNRIYVPSTGKYHNTLPAGQQQRIVP